MTEHVSVVSVKGKRNKGEKMNGYFQIIQEDMGTYLKVFRETEGGHPISLQEVVMYLSKEKIPFDLKQLNTDLQAAKDGTMFLLTPNQLYPVGESSKVEITPNGMEAKIRFYPPSNLGKPYRKEDFYSVLRMNKIAYGIVEDVIEDFMANPQYCTDYVIAVGTPTREGTDAIIEYKFETDNKIRPTLLEDGSVDFFNLNVVNHCKEGDVLAVLTPEDPGEAGRDVYGVVIKPRDVKKLALKHGLNIELNEDHTVMYSKVNGHVSYVDGQVFVANVLEVDNVDNSTGNITYEGNVCVKGNVCSNFAIFCKGNVEVRGVVEAARIEAEGNIILNRGINGMGKGFLRTKGNVVAKYLENCQVEAEGYVETEAIMHSHVKAGTEINVVSKKGFITGGSVSATNVIRVKSLGTNMGATTEVMVGVNPNIVTRYGELKKEIAEAQKNLKVMMPVLEAAKKKMKAGIAIPPEQLKNIQQLAVSSKELQTKLLSNTKEMEAMEEMMDTGIRAKVEISDTVYPGNKITISDVSMIIKDTFKFCRFVKKDGDVKMEPL